ncbi:DUF72 domain-containing protein [Amnibacterium kyonggiense]|uniref:Uncharacterized protein YecE (DUF72 family) n=1 Tax=Amnibacterium kyonggiense TaxID=595671 RepID=A0A4R7FT28_9MICO|nr:DUF72 domain-containing protein [Amnibacterium kyonggiense]TDS81010.1 uncharacterized protein YecE (DUF72 family) [Amnibacterium kyonggiense]
MAHIGTSGWSYDHWEGLLYPAGFDSLHRLHAYAASFQTAEVHADFRHQPPHAAFTAWQHDTPDGFQLSLFDASGPARDGGLTAPEVWAERIAVAWEDLGPRQGMVLVHLHPEIERDDAHLDALLGALPEDVSVAVELRHDSWLDEEVYRLLERRGAAYCVMSGPGLPTVLRPTAERVYVRFHGADHGTGTAGSYRDDELQGWAERIAAWEDAGHEVFAYFANDLEGYAVRNAAKLVELLV